MKKIFAIFSVLMLVIISTACRRKPEDSGLNKEMIKDVNVRRAIALAIDKAYYTNKLLENGSYPADYYIPFDFYSYNGVDFRTQAEEMYPELTNKVYEMPGDGGYAPSGYNHYDIAEAKRLWKEAKEKYGVGDRTVTFKFLVHSAESWTPLYEHIKSEIEKNLEGAKVDLNVVTFGEKLAIQKTGDFDILFSGWGPDYQDPVTFLDIFLPISGLNNVNYNNERFAKLVSDAKNARITGFERFKALVEAEKILLYDDVVVMPIFQSRSVSLQNPDIENLWGQKVGPDFFLKWVVSKKANNDKTLNLLQTSNIPDLKSWTAQDQVSFYFLGSINEGLMTSHNPKGETPYVPGVAESYEKIFNEDGTVTYRFYLRQTPWVTGNGEIYTVDGEPQYVKAQDFVFGWKMLADPREASPYQYMIETIGLVGSDKVLELSSKSSQEEIETALNNLGIKAIDDYTLDVTLTFDSTYFISLMSFPSFYPVHEEFYKAQGKDAQGLTKYAESQNVNSVLYNGPFYFSSWKNDDKNVLTKNPHYWDKDNVDLNQVVWLVKPNINPETEVEMYRQGQIDRAVLRNASTQRDYSGRPDAHVSGSTTAWYLEFNVNNH